MDGQNVPSAPEPVTNIVLVGRTGNGKSATGNTIINAKEFQSKKQAGGVTMKCKMFRAAIQDGPIINVIDTPGLFDLSVTAEYISEEIVRCLSMAEEGIHAVLFVLSVKNRISQEEESTLNTLQRIFESKILDYFIVVFTGGDELEADKLTLDQYLGDGCPKFLTRVLRLCGTRKVLFDNKTTDKDKKAKQLKELLDLIANVAKQTGGIPYTDNMHRQIKEENDKLRQRERRIDYSVADVAERARMKELSRKEHQQNISLWARMVERTLRRSDEEHEREMKHQKKMEEDSLCIII